MMNISIVIILDAPSAPSLRVLESTVTSLLVTWELTSDGNPISGFILFLRQESKDWEERPLFADIRTFNLSNLDCGRRYDLYIVAYNEVGRGQASDVISSKTDGSPPLAPGSANQLVASNSTFAAIELSSWRSGGCPLAYFVVQYKVRTSRDWLLLSNHVTPGQATLLVSDLRPATWYSLLVTAINEAGSTEAEFSFATLTTSGHAIPAFSATSSASFADRAKLVLPIVSTLVVIALAITVMCVLKRKTIAGHGGHSARPGQNIYLDSSNSCSGKDGEAIPLNEQKRHSLACYEVDSNSGAGQTPNRMAGYLMATPGHRLAGPGQQVFLPSPYAMSVFDGSRDATIVKKGSSATPAGHHLVHQIGQHQENKLNATRQVDQHYDVPFKQVRVLNLHMSG